MSHSKLEYGYIVLTRTVGKSSIASVGPERTLSWSVCGPWQRPYAGEHPPLLKSASFSSGEPAHPRATGSRVGQLRRGQWTCTQQVGTQQHSAEKVNVFLSSEAEVAGRYSYVMTRAAPLTANNANNLFINTHNVLMMRNI